MTPQSPSTYPTYNPQGPAPFGYLLLLLGSLFLFSMVTSLLARLVQPFWGDDAYLGMALAQNLSFTAMGGASIVTEYYHQRRTATYLYRDTHKRHTASYYLMLIGLLAFASVPIEYMSYLGERYAYPAWTGEIGLKLRQVEQQIDALMLSLLENGTPLSIVLTWFSLVVLAPVAEELLFRGALQGWLYARTHRVHLTVWVVAIIFSAVHMQWTGFGARVLMGGLLGYVAFYGSLRHAVMLHMLNNLLAVILYYILDDLNASSQLVAHSPLLFAWATPLSLVGIVLLLRRISSVR